MNTNCLRGFVLCWSAGMPVALVGHSVTQLRMRPPWVAGVAAPLKQLVEECWAHAPNDRCVCVCVFPGGIVVCVVRAWDVALGCTTSVARWTLERQLCW